MGMVTKPREVWGDLATSAFIEASHLFKSLDEEAREDLIKLAQSVCFTAGEVVLRQGEGGEFFYLIQDGSVDVTALRDGQAAEVGILDRGAFFGESHALTGAPHRATISARTDICVIQFPSPIIGALAERFPKVRKLLEAVSSGRGKETTSKADD
jgi:CRP-like cAMP-binding protein